MPGRAVVENGEWHYGFLRWWYGDWTGREARFLIADSFKKKLSLAPGCWLISDLPGLDQLAEDIEENLEGVLESFKAVIASLNAKQ